jgi:hypothetical protein
MDSETKRYVGRLSDDGRVVVGDESADTVAVWHRTREPTGEWTLAESKGAVPPCPAYAHSGARLFVPRQIAKLDPMSGHPRPAAGHGSASLSLSSSSSCRFRPHGSCDDALYGGRAQARSRAARRRRSGLGGGGGTTATTGRNKSKTGHVRPPAAPLHYDALRALLPASEAFSAQRHLPVGGMAGRVLRSVVRRS